MPGMIPGLLEMNPAFRNMRGYQFGYDTQQTPFEVAKERGVAGVLGGAIDNITRGATDLDKRGDSKKNKDAKEFLNKFIYGTDGMRQEGESKKSFVGRPLPEFGVSEKLGLRNFGN